MVKETPASQGEDWAGGKRVPQQDYDISKMRPDGKRPWRRKSSNLDETNQGKSSNLDETNRGEEITWTRKTKGERKNDLDETNQGRERRQLRRRTFRG